MLRIPTKEKAGTLADFYASRAHKPLLRSQHGLVIDRQAPVSPVPHQLCQLKKLTHEPIYFLRLHACDHTADAAILRHEEAHSAYRGIFQWLTKHALGYPLQMQLARLNLARFLLSSEATQLYDAWSVVQQGAFSRQFCH